MPWRPNCHSSSGRLLSFCYTLWYLDITSCSTLGLLVNVSLLSRHSNYTNLKEETFSFKKRTKKRKSFHMECGICQRS